MTCYDNVKMDELYSMIWNYASEHKLNAYAVIGLLEDIKFELLDGLRCESDKE